MERLEAVINDVVFQSDDKMFCVLRAENKSFGHFAWFIMALRRI